jgi:hypothetical protein
MRTDLRALTGAAEGGARKMGDEELAQAIIADCAGDPSAAVLAMVKINSALMVELAALTFMRAHERGAAGHH